MITNESQLAIKLSSDIKIALDNTMKIALNVLLDYIEKDVYSYPTTWTNGSDGDEGRTRDFLNSWNSTKTEIVYNSLGSFANAQIMQDKVLEHISPFIHGSDYKKGKLNSDNLSGIINDGLKKSHFNFPAIESRPFWDDFIKWCDKELANTFYQECRKIGVPIQGGAFVYEVG